MHGLFCAVVDLNNGPVDLITGGRLLFAGRGNGANLISRGKGIVDNFAQGLARFVGKFRSGFYLFKSVFYAANALGRALLTRRNGIAHIVGRGHGFFGQFAHFVGHHGKTATSLASACRFNGGIKGQQVGLVGNV